MQLQVGSKSYCVPPCGQQVTMEEFEEYVQAGVCCNPNCLESTVQEIYCEWKKHCACEGNDNFECNVDGSQDGKVTCNDMQQFVQDLDNDLQNEDCPALTDEEKIDLMCCFLQKCASQADPGEFCDDDALAECAAGVLGRPPTPKELAKLKSCAGGSGGNGCDGGGGGGPGNEVNPTPGEGPEPPPNGGGGGGGGGCGGNTGSGGGSNGHPTLSPFPVDVFYGDKIEAATDLTVRLTGADYMVRRQYTSDPDYVSAELIGDQWTATPFRFIKFSPPAGGGGSGSCCSACSGGYGKRCTFLCDSCADVEDFPEEFHLAGPTSQVYRKTSSHATTFNTLSGDLSSQASGRWSSCARTIKRRPAVGGQ